MTKLDAHDLSIPAPDCSGTLAPFLACQLRCRNGREQDLKESGAELRTVGDDHAKLAQSLAVPPAP